MTITAQNERREHSRHRAHVVMEIRGEVEESRIAEIRGVTVDLGRGGALVVFRDHVPANPDHPFMVRFVDATGTVIAPGFRWGAVLRADRLRSDTLVAVRFQQPLPPFVLGELLGAHPAPAAASADNRLRRGYRRVSSLLGKAQPGVTESTHATL